jgi:hypothetical protein
MQGGTCGLCEYMTRTLAGESVPVSDEDEDLSAVGSPGATFVPPSEGSASPYATEAASLESDGTLDEALLLAADEAERAEAMDTDRDDAGDVRSPYFAAATEKAAVPPAQGASALVTPDEDGINMAEGDGIDVTEGDGIDVVEGGGIDVAEGGADKPSWEDDDDDHASEDEDDTQPLQVEAAQPATPVAGERASKRQSEAEMATEAEDSLSQNAGPSAAAGKAVASRTSASSLLSGRNSIRSTSSRSVSPVKVITTSII